MIVEWGWKEYLARRALPGGPVLNWVPRVVQEELFEYVDCTVSVSGQDEDEDTAF